MKQTLYLVTNGEYFAKIALKGINILTVSIYFREKSDIFNQIKDLDYERIMKNPVIWKGEMSMGLIRAGIGAMGGTLADQWKEFFYCDSMGKDVLVTKGQK